MKLYRHEIAARQEQCAPFAYEPQEPVTPTPSELSPVHPRPSPSAIVTQYSVEQLERQKAADARIMELMRKAREGEEEDLRRVVNDTTV